MHKHSKINLWKSSIIIKLLILCIFFPLACTKKKPTIDVEDREKVQSFLNQFLFVEYGAYTLFGDKPITEMLMFIGTEDDLMELTEEDLKNAASFPWDDSIVDNWKIWKRYADKLPSKKFIITERPCFLDPCHTFYGILNVKRVREILDKHRELFQEKIGSSFDRDIVIQEYKDPKSSFWKKVNQDHYLSGLLYGYGEENVAYFLNHLKTQDGEYHSSEEYKQKATVDNFSIPTFAVSPEDKMAAHYHKQRESIKNIFRGKDIIDVTLQRLLE